MARPRLRHCKECPFYSKSRSEKYHVCKKDFGTFGRYMNAQEVRTSPRWCPLGRNLRRSIVG